MADTVHVQAQRVNTTKTNNNEGIDASSNDATSGEGKSGQQQGQPGGAGEQGEPRRAASLEQQRQQQQQQQRKAAATPPPQSSVEKLRAWRESGGQVGIFSAEFEAKFVKSSGKIWKNMKRHASYIAAGPGGSMGGGGR
jgi:hypothetical protein